MDISVEKDATHVLVTFTAENAVEGYQLGRAERMIHDSRSI